MWRWLHLFVTTEENQSKLHVVDDTSYSSWMSRTRFIWIFDRFRFHFESTSFTIDLIVRIKFWNWLGFNIHNFRETFVKKFCNHCWRRDSMAEKGQKMKLNENLKTSMTMSHKKKDSNANSLTPLKYGFLEEMKMQITRLERQEKAQLKTIYERYKTFVKFCCWF